MAKRKTTLKKFIEKIENIPEFKLLPRPIRNLFKESLKSMITVEFPIFTFKENEWIIAHTPLIDVSAQGKTEEEAIDNIKAMIDDYMTDPDTQKPKIKTIINMQIGMKSIPMKLPITALETGEHHGREDTRIAAG